MNYAGNIQNLVAIISQDVKNERMNEITNILFKCGDGSLDVNSYDLEFDKVAFLMLRRKCSYRCIIYCQKQVKYCTFIDHQSGVNQLYQS